MNLVPAAAATPARPSPGHPRLRPDDGRAAAAALDGRCPGSSRSLGLPRASNGTLPVLIGHGRHGRGRGPAGVPGPVGTPALDCWRCCCAIRIGVGLAAWLTAGARSARWQSPGHGRDGPLRGSSRWARCSTAPWSALLRRLRQAVRDEHGRGRGGRGLSDPQIAACATRWSTKLARQILSSLSPDVVERVTDAAHGRSPVGSPTAIEAHGVGPR